MERRRPGQGQDNVIGERISTRAIEALMSNYRDSQQAFLEIVDNAIDNRIEGKPLIVRIRVGRDELSVSNHGGEGLDFDGLTTYFTWGHSEKTDRIGKYGVGGKAAMGFLGRGMEIVCSADGSDEEFRVSDPAWESRDEELRQYTAERRKATSPDGYFKVRVTDLKREVNPTALMTKIGDIYRPLLLDGSVRITVNSKEVDPLQIRYFEEDPSLRPRVAIAETRLGQEIMLKVGILAEGQRVKPGIRCYYRGRLIEDEQFFGHPTPAQMAGSSRIIGEAHLDFVPVTPNKSTFIRSSVQWDTASNAMKNALAPWIQKAEKLRGDQKVPVERYELDLARRAKRVLEHVLAETGLIAKAQLPGGSTGRMPPTLRETPPLPPKGTHRTPRPTEGATAPRLPATGETIKRWGAGHEVDVVSMGNELTRSSMVVDDKGKRIIKINSEFPLYQVAKKLGEDAMEVYMTETIATEVCRVVAQEPSVVDYNDMLNQILSECGKIFRNRIGDRRNQRR